MSASPKRNYRRITTEEGFCIPEVTQARQKLLRDQPSRFSVPVQAMETFEKNAIEALMLLLTDLGEGRIAAMDSGGIDTQLLLLAFAGIQDFEPRQALELSRLVNDRLADAVKRYPGRFAGLAVAPPQDPQGAAQEIERAVRTLGLKGLLINSHTNGEFLDDLKFRPIFEVLSALDVPLYLHPRDPSPVIADALLPFALDGAVWGYAAEMGLHALRLIFSGLFDDLPKLRVAIGHGGEGIPAMLWRIDRRAGIEGMNIRGRRLKRKPSEYFRENFVVTTSGMNWLPIVNLCHEVVGPDNLLFAVDYPFEDNNEALRMLEGLNFSPEDKKKFFQTNAERFFKLDPQ